LRTYAAMMHGMAHGADHPSAQLMIIREGVHRDADNHRFKAESQRPHCFLRKGQPWWPPPTPQGRPREHCGTMAGKFVIRSPSAHDDDTQSTRSSVSKRSQMSYSRGASALLVGVNGHPPAPQTPGQESLKRTIGTMGSPAPMIRSSSGPALISHARYDQAQRFQGHSSEFGFHCSPDMRICFAPADSPHPTAHLNPNGGVPTESWRRHEKRGCSGIPANSRRHGAQMSTAAGVPHWHD